MSLWKRGTDWLLELLYPTRCLLCRKPMERGPVQLCPSCRRRLARASGEEGELSFRCVSPFAYQEPLRSLFLRYKFGGREFYSRTFGFYLSRAVERELKGDFDLVTWVPLSRSRRWRRGYDQAKLLAQAVAEDSGAPLVPTLVKVRRTRTQSHLTRDEERRRNVSGAYRLRPEAARAVSGCRVLLIDDIRTSGATLESCGGVLRSAGAEVVCATLARRPHEAGRQEHGTFEKGRGH